MPVSALVLPAGHVVTAVEATRMAEATQPWASYTPSLAGVAGSASARWTRHGDTVKVHFAISLTGAPTTTVTMSLPVNASSFFAFGLLNTRGTVSGLRSTTPNTGFVRLASATTVAFLSAGTSAGDWATGYPVAWASGDQWGGSFEYEAA